MSATDRKVGIPGTALTAETGMCWQEGWISVRHGHHEVLTVNAGSDELAGAVLAQVVAQGILDFCATWRKVVPQ